MMRTTLYLPETLHQRLHIASKNKKKSVSQLATTLLDKALADEEKINLDRLYQGFEELEGMAGNEVTDASATIDALLYGEKGAWRGSEK